MKFTLYAAILFCACAAQHAAAHVAKAAIPEIKGVLELDVGPGDFQTQVRPDGKEVQLRALQRQDGLAITAFLQRVNFPGSAERCKTEWWTGTKNSVPVQRDDVQESTKDGIARVEYVIPEFRGVKYDRKTSTLTWGVLIFALKFISQKPGSSPRTRPSLNEYCKQCG